MAASSQLKAFPPKEPHRSLPFHYQLLAGGIAGTTEVCIMYPLDVVKTRFQLQVGKGEYSSIISCLRMIVQQEGFKRLYRGIFPPILMDTPKRALKFSANEQCGAFYRRQFTTDNKMTRALSVLTGISAGITESMVIVPFELIKIRLQNKKSSGIYKNTLDCLRKVVKSEGILALYKGLESTLWRNGVWNGVYFGVIHSIRTALPIPKNHQNILRNDFIAGAMGGILGTTINTPFDVTKTRIQNQQGRLFSGVTPKYNWVLPAVKTIYQEEGFKALYKGYLPKVIRLGPGGGILLVIFDQVSLLVRKHLL